MNKHFLTVGRPVFSGFSLVELMIVVAVVGILAAIAYPSYLKSVKQSNRAAAKSALTDLAAREEKYLSINNTYIWGAGAIAGLYGATSTLTFPLQVPGSGPATYQITQADITGTAAAGLTPPTFTIQADPVGSQTGDACGSFIINSVGQQTVTGTGSCW
jgi:type IV pilus assembly protein PilE